ncbi:YraN family protein [Planctomycetota bacterium]|nr:YraN family protein [Planctomycetota bacterium]
MPNKLTSLTLWILTQITGRDTHIHTVGYRGETAATRFLRKNNYRIIRRNLKLRLGEVDILARDPDGSTIVLIEVKSTISNDPDAIPPESHITSEKQEKLITLASVIQKKFNLQLHPIRIDVITVTLPEKITASPTINHYKDAIQTAATNWL